MSALLLQTYCQVIVENEAAYDLNGRDYYDFVFKEEQDWVRNGENKAYQHSFSIRS